MLCHIELHISTYIYIYLIYVFICFIMVPAVSNNQWSTCKPHEPVQYQHEHPLSVSHNLTIPINRRTLISLTNQTRWNHVNYLHSCFIPNSPAYSCRFRQGSHAPNTPPTSTSDWQRNKNVVSYKTGVPESQEGPQTLKPWFSPRNTCQNSHPIETELVPELAPHLCFSFFMLYRSP